MVRIFNCSGSILLAVVWELVGELNFTISEHLSTTNRECVLGLEVEEMGQIFSTGQAVSAEIRPSSVPASPVTAAQSGAPLRDLGPLPGGASR